MIFVWVFPLFRLWLVTVVVIAVVVFILFLIFFIFICRIHFVTRRERKKSQTKHSKHQKNVFICFFPSSTVWNVCPKTTAEKKQNNMLFTVGAVENFVINLFTWLCQQICSRIFCCESRLIRPWTLENMSSQTTRYMDTSWNFLPSLHHNARSAYNFNFAILLSCVDIRSIRTYNLCLNTRREEGKNATKRTTSCWKRSCSIRIASAVRHQ